MKIIKIFIIIGLVFLLGSIGAVGYVWHVVQDSLSVDQSEVVAPSDELLVSDSTQEQETFSGSVVETIPEEGVALPPDTLSEKQKAIAQSIGIDTDSFMLTPQMVECAEEKLGTTRIQEIMLGDAPSVLEAARLTPCL